MGLPQHWLQDDVRAGMERLAAPRPEPAACTWPSTPTSTPPQSVTPLVAEARQGDARRSACATCATRACSCAGVNDSAARRCSTCASRCSTAPAIMPYYFYMCDMIPFAEHWRVSVGAGAGAAARASWATCPASPPRGSSATCPFVGKRWVHQIDEYDRERGISYWTKNYRTGIERTTPTRSTAATSTTTRSTRCPRPARPGGASTARRSTMLRPPTERRHRGPRPRSRWRNSPPSSPT